MKISTSFLLMLVLWSSALFGLEENEIKYPVYAIAPPPDSILDASWNIILPPPDKKSPMSDMGDLKFLGYGNEASEFQLETSGYQEGNYNSTNCSFKLKKGKQEKTCVFTSRSGDAMTYKVQSDVVFLRPSIVMNYLWDSDSSAQMPLPYFIIRLTLSAESKF